MKNCLSILILGCLAAACAPGDSFDRARVVANPIDLNYAFHGTESAFGGGFGGYSPTGPYVYKLEAQQRQRQQMRARQGGAAPGAFQIPRPRVDNSAGAREAADPVVMVYRDRYYLFPSKSRGYWSSPDMQHWTYIPTEVLPIDLYEEDS